MSDPPLTALPPGGSNPGPRTERCLLGNKVVMLPEMLIERTSIFQHVVSMDTWKNVLSDQERRQLEALLPAFPENDAAEKNETLTRLFGGENFKFGNPLQQLHQKMKDGLLSPEIARSNRLGRKFRKRDYKFSQQNYYTALLQEVILNRERTLNLRNGLPPEAPLPFCHSPKPDRNKVLNARVRKNYHRTLREVREECNVEETSSEEEDITNDPIQRSRRQLHRSLGPIPSPEPTTPSVQATFASKPSTLNGDISGNENAKRPRALSPVEITEEHYRQMLKRHKKRRLEEPDMPELDITEITLQDILTRCQASGKKTVKAVSVAVPTNGEAAPETSETSLLPLALKKKPPRMRDKGDKKLKRKIKLENIDVDEIGDEHLTLPQQPPALDGSDILTQRDDDGVPDFPLPDTLPARLTMGQTDSFFSLLRDIICDFPDTKATTAKVEERVREWQESPASALNPWLHHQQNWVDCVVSALKFLSGDILGLSVENFVPFLDYKERAQQWKWIGIGRDSNQQLSPLFHHWLAHRSATPVDGFVSTQGSPPPVRAKTSFVVRPTSAAEKAVYRDQERRRFDNPHRAFTYRLHGYDSVVGPVKGVYNKENAITKAREHNLLVSDRPAFVTILTLVRDAAARLPNGEGTRGDICELLKDSQFLAPGVTDTQINTVVSGALDRLHSEKDPCVKYDVNSKLWIYLHRSRTEEEFERIHQAQGAAAKAKKSLQRPKASKAIKDHVSQSTSVTVKAALAQSMAASTSTPVASSSSGELTLESLNSLMTSVSSPAPSPVGPSPKVARSTKSKPNAVAKPAVPASASASIAAVSMTSPMPQVVTSTPVRKTAGKAQAKHRPAVINMAAGGTAAASLLGARAQTTAALLAHGNGSSLLTGKPAAMGSVGLAKNKPPVVNMASKGLTAGTKISGLTLGEVTVTGGSGGGGTKPSSIILAQDLSSRSSTPTRSVATPPPTTAKLVTLAQSSSGAGSVVVTGASDNAVLQRLVQQVASGQQMMSVSSVQAARSLAQAGAQQMMAVSNMPAARALAQAGSQQRGTTLKIQGGSIMQPVIGGKPLQISGKPLLQLSGKGAQPLGVIQTSHGQISTLSLIPQALASAGQMSPATVNSGAAVVGGKMAAAACASGTSSPVTLAMVSAGSPGGKATVLTSAGAANLQSQAKVVTPSHAGMMVTQLPPGISIRPGLTGVQQGKVIGQAGLVPAQFIVQQAATGNSGQAAAQGTPIIVSQAGKVGSQNIQVVRTMLSQQGLKPGQATILISQPALQQASIPTAQVLRAAAAAAPAAGAVGGVAAAAKSANRGSPKGKSQPVYARIIQPPPAIKLTTVGGPAQSSNMLQTVSKLLSLSASAPAVSSAPIMVAASGPLAMAQAGQSLLKSQQPSDFADSDLSSTEAQT